MKLEANADVIPNAKYKCGENLEFESRIWKTMCNVYCIWAMKLNANASTRDV